MNYLQIFNSCIECAQEKVRNNDTQASMAYSNIASAIAKASLVGLELYQNNEGKDCLREVVIPPTKEDAIDKIQEIINKATKCVEPCCDECDGLVKGCKTACNQNCNNCIREENKSKKPC